MLINQLVISHYKANDTLLWSSCSTYYGVRYTNAYAILRMPSLIDQCAQTYDERLYYGELNASLRTSWRTSHLIHHAANANDIGKQSDSCILESRPHDYRFVPTPVCYTPHISHPSPSIFFLQLCKTDWWPLERCLPSPLHSIFALAFNQHLDEHPISFAIPYRQ